MEIVWNGIAGTSVERCRVTEHAGVQISSVIEGEPVACSYELHASSGWEFRSLRIEVGEHTVTVERSDAVWAVDGVPRTDLAPAHEVDISVSPLSNTLPIRRLALDIGASADIVTAYVSVPDLTVTTDPQRYTRVGAHEYLYESRDSDFRRTVTVDDAGLVLDYPGLFERRPAL